MTNAILILRRVPYLTQEKFCAFANFFLFSSQLLRGYREKSLHKVLTKNKEPICNTMAITETRLSWPLAHRLQSLVGNQQPLKEEEDQQEDNKDMETGTVTTKNEQTTEDDGKEMEVDAVEAQDEGESSASASLVKDKQPCSPSSVKRLVLPEEGTTIVEWDPCFPDKVREGFLKLFKYLEGMEARLFDAHLPVEVPYFLK